MIFVSVMRRLLLVAVAGWCWSGCFPMASGTLDEDKNPHYQAGKSRVMSRDYQGAIEAFEKALEANPNSALAHFDLGVVYYQNAGDYEFALYHFKKYLQLRPEAPQAENVRQMITVCKQELAKGVSLAMVSQQISSQVNDLIKENLKLRQQVDTLGQNLMLATNRPALVATAPANPAPVAPVPAPAARATPNVASDATGATRAPTRSPAATAARSHTVKSGDTPASIARQYNVKLPALLAANPNLDPKWMKIGQPVSIPAP